MPNDVECAFCGRALDTRRQVSCDDCQLTHTVCPSCADEVAAGQTGDGYRLVA